MLNKTVMLLKRVSVKVDEDQNSKRLANKRLFYIDQRRAKIKIS